MTVTQRRGRKIMMKPAELDAFLTRSAHLPGRDGLVRRAPRTSARSGSSGTAPRSGSTRSPAASAGPTLRRDPRVAVVVDAGEEYGELRGVELSGAVEFVGEAPRTGEPVPRTRRGPERLFARKNFGIDEMPHDGRHAWLRLTPDAIASWDFRKLGSL